MCAIDHADFSLGAFFHRLPASLSPPFQCSWPLIFDSACLSDGRSGPCEVSFALSSWLQRGNRVPRTSSSVVHPSEPDRWLRSAPLEPPLFQHGKSRSNFFHISRLSRRIGMDICSILPTNHHGRENRSEPTSQSRSSRLH